ncbi:hypothetical protein KSC_031780 [Ktedonobacter sp. SOSP1-52]|nr:hypothetical protein KSC_031780 [Ktedonobacter sp. SOSP1-52]
MALSSGNDKTVRVWDLVRGHCLQTLYGHTVNSIGMSTDGQIAITNERGREGLLWETRAGHSIKSLKGHTSELTFVDMSGDNRLALTGYADGTMQVWEVSNGHRLQSWQGHRQTSSQTISLNQDASLVLTGGNGVSLTLWDSIQGRQLREYISDSRGYSASSISGNGRIACSGRVDGAIRVWDVASGCCLRTLRQYTRAVTALRLSHDGHTMLSASADGTLHVWHIHPATSLSTFALSRIYTLNDVASFSSRAEQLLQQTIQALTQTESTDDVALEHLRGVRSLAGWERVPESLSLWQQLSKQCHKVKLRSGWLLQVLGEQAKPGEKASTITAVSLRSDGRTALTADSTGVLSVWDLNTGRMRRSLQLPRDEQGPQPRWDGLEASQQWALSLHRDGIIVQRSVTRRISSSLAKGIRHVHDRVLLHPRERFVLVGDSSTDYALRLWDPSGGWLLRTLTGHTAAIRALCLGMDGSLALSGSNDQTIRVWEIQNGHCLYVLQGHTAGVSSVSLTTDNRLALSGSWDRTVRIWEVSSGRCLRTLQGHMAGVSVLCTSADNRFVFSGDLDGLIRIWEVSSGRCLWTLQGHTDMITSISCSTDVRFVLSSSADGTARLWELDWELEVRATADWDDGALPFLETFLELHRSYVIHKLSPYRQPSAQEIDQALTLNANPYWEEESFQGLLLHLQRVGYGWLRSSGVRRKLAELAPSQQQFPSF